MTEPSEMEVTNPEGLDAIFRAHYERIARVIGRVIHDQARAEELAVEVFLKWWRNPQAPIRAHFQFCPRVASHAGALVRRQRRAAQGANRARSFESASCGAIALVEPRPQLPGDCRLSRSEFQLRRKSCRSCSRSVPEGVFETIWKTIMKIAGSPTGLQLSNHSGVRT